MTIQQTHVVQALEPGGIESLAVNLAVSASDSLELVSLVGEAAALTMKWDALKPVAGQLKAFGKAGGLRPGLVLSLARHFRRSRTQAVVTHHIGPLLYAGIAARLAGVPVVAHVEHDAWHYDNARRRRVGRLAMKLVRPRLAAVSQAVADGVARGIGCRAQIISNGTDLGKFKPLDKADMRRNLGLPLKQRLVGCAGRLEEVKGFDLLIQAMVHLPPNVTAVIFGIGSQEEALRDKTRALGLCDRVIFAGLSSHMDEVYPAFDMFCLPSRFEGLPLAALEAQACGIAVAAFDVGGVSEAVDPKTGILVPPGDTAALSRAIAKLLDTPSSRSPRDYVRDHFSFDQTIRAYAELTRI